MEFGNRDSDSDSLWEKVILLDGRRLLPKQGFEPTSSRSVANACLHHLTTPPLFGSVMIAWLCSCSHPYKGKADHVHRRDQPSF